METGSGIRKLGRLASLMSLAALSAACVAEGTTVMDVNDVPANLSIVVAGGDPAAPIGPIDLEVGESVSLAAVATNAIGLAVGSVDGIWTSSDAAVATVTADGVVTGVAAGTADITVVAQDLEATVSVNVVEPGTEPSP